MLIYAQIMCFFLLANFNCVYISVLPLPLCLTISYLNVCHFGFFIKAM